MSLTTRDRIATITADLRATVRRFDRAVPEMGDWVTELLEIADQLDMLAVNMRVVIPKEKP